MRTRTLLSLSAALALRSSVALGQSDAFTAEERRRLVAGELVRRDMTRTDRGARLFGGSSWQRVDAPLERVWAVVREPSRYPRLIPSLETVRVVARRGDEHVLRMHHAFGVGSADYFMRMTIDDATHTIRFALDESRPRDVQAGRGFVSLTPYRGGTIVAWGMLADVGGGMLQQVFGPFLNEWLLKPPRCVRDEIEPGRVNEC